MSGFASGEKAPSRHTTDCSGAAVFGSASPRLRAPTDGRGRVAAAATVIGILAFAVGAAIWAFAEELGI
jgi:hypothetical protein